VPYIVGSTRSIPTSGDAIRDQLAGVPDLKLVVLDPLSTFAQVDLDADNCAVGFVAGKLGSLASDLRATVIATHHMRKHRANETPKTPAQPRELIRGASNIVDGVRVAYALWTPDDSDGADICKRMRLPYTPGRVVKGGVVKANDKADRSIVEYIRTDDGLLLDRTSDIRATRESLDNLRSDLIASVAMRAEAGHPFTVTGMSGLHEQREKLPPSLQALSRDKLRDLAKELPEEGAIKKCLAQGSSTDKWLNVPGGPFWLGQGTFVHGAPIAESA
jgi:hypothetical protein